MPKPESQDRIVLTRAQFDLIDSQGTDLVRDFVPVPEWAPSGVDPSKVFVCIRTMTGSERDRFEASTGTQRGKERILNLENVRAKLVAMCLIDEETGERIYSEAEIATLGKRSAKALDRVFDACRVLSGLTQATLEAKGDDLKNG